MSYGKRLKFCRLYLEEKLAIITDKEIKNLLNKRLEIMIKFRYDRNFPLIKWKPGSEN